MNSLRINNRKNYLKQKGGVLLGEGGFGCVISPPLKCKKTFHKFPYSIDTNYISKIVEYDESDESIWNEIDFGRKLIKIDPSQKYFSPILDGCFLHRQKNKDLSYSLTSKKYNSNSNSSSSSSSSSNLTKKKDKCVIYLDTQYLNLISKNAGITIEDTFESKDLYLRNYIKNNYIRIMYHYCKALKLLKENGILHCDIKTMNVMINYNKVRDTAGLTLIDFGLSNNINPTSGTNYDILNCTANGTQVYKPIEITVLYEVLYLMKKNPKNYSNKVALKRIFESFKDNKKFYKNVLDFNRYGIKKKFSSDESLYGNTDDILKVYKDIVDKYNNKTLTTTFLNNNDIFKWDVFSLGILFSEIFLIFNIHDEKAEKLINNMIHPFYWNRYDIEQCLKDQLFMESKIRRTKKKI